jgi:hypothetical protein
LLGGGLAGGAEIVAEGAEIVDLREMFLHVHNPIVRI